MATMNAAVLRKCNPKSNAMKQNASETESNVEREPAKLEPSDVEINPENVKCIILDGHQYSFNRMVGNAQRWMCLDRSCFAYFEIVKNRLRSCSTGHTHPPEVDREGEQSKVAVPEQIVTSENSKVSKLDVKTLHLGSSRCPSKLKKRPLPNVVNSPECSVPIVCSVKKKMARQWTQNSAGNSRYDSVLDDNSAQDTSTCGFASRSKSPEFRPSAEIPSPAKSPKLSEIGPPPSPPLSQTSPSPQLEDPGSPCLPVFDLSELKCTTPDFVFSQPSLTEWSLPQDESQPAVSSPSLSPAEIERFKYKEYENMMIRLDHEGFGRAVTSLLTELSTRPANQVRSEIASLLYRAVEQHAGRVTKKD